MGSAALVRVAVLAQLLAAAWGLGHEEFQLVAVALAVTAAAQVFTDSGAAAYLSVLDGDRASVPVVVRQLVLWQLLVGCATVLVSAVLVLRVADSPGTWTTVGLLAVPATSVAESLGRLCRVVWLRAGTLQPYASTDAAFASARVVSMLLLLLGLGTASFVVGLVAAVLVTRRVASGAFAVLAPAPWWGGRRLFVGTARRALSYGVPVMAAGLYSQAPVVVTAAIAPLETAAVVAVATRLVQPLEWVAASWCQMVLPRLARGRVPRRRLHGVLVVQGVVLGLLGAIGAGVLLHLWDAPQPVWVLTAVLLAVLPVKYLNYGLATVLTATGRPEVRTWVSLTLGVSCTSTLVWVAHGPVVQIAAVVAVNELLLALGLGGAVRMVTRERVRADG